MMLGLFDSISRITEFYRRHGLNATVRRAGVGVRRALFASRMVVFYCDLTKQSLPVVKIPNSFTIERLHNEADLGPRDLRAMTDLWNPKLARRNINERFAKGACLWLVKSGDHLAGHGWTLLGNAIAPSYFPMGPDDAQLFDFYVVSRFRGRAIHWLLTAYILQTMAAENVARAFADTNEWNQAQLASFKMTPFRRLGLARTFTLFGRKFISWVEAPSIDLAPQRHAVRSKAAIVARPHER